MNNSYNGRKVFDLCLIISILLFLLHLYYFCSSAAAQWGLMPGIALNVMIKIEDTGFFRYIWFSKLLALVFLALSLMGPAGRRDKKVGWESTVALISIGLMLFFVSAY